MNTQDNTILSLQQLMSKFAQPIAQDQARQAAEAASTQAKITALTQKLIKLCGNSVMNMNATDAIGIANGQGPHRINIDEQTLCDCEQLQSYRDVILSAVNSELNQFGWRVFFDRAACVTDYYGKSYYRDTPFIAPFCGPPRVAST